jgi:ATP-dependent DNA ligase
LQDFRSEASRIHYYIFDLLVRKDRDLERRDLLKSLVQVRNERIRISGFLEAAPSKLLSAIREQGLECVVGKRKDSLYEPAKRTGAWIKHRVNQGQEFVIGGYIPGPPGSEPPKLMLPMSTLWI